MASFKCTHCGMLLPTRYERDKHTMNKHVSHVIVGETNVKLTKAGFPCPGCVSVLKNAKEFSRHLLKLHNLTCKLITDPKPSRFTVQESPIPGSSASSDSTSHSFTNTDTDTLSDTNIPTNTDTDTLSDTNIPTNTVRSSSVYSFEFPLPAANDRFKFMDTDISERFHKFQLAVKATIDQESMTLTFEEHVQHILALSGILLLKPGRTHADLHEHIDLDTCDRLQNHILTSILTTRHHIFPSNIKDLVEKIVKRLVNSEPLVLTTYNGPYTRIYASREIMMLMEDATWSPTNRILTVIRNMVECLPRNIIGDGPQEIELTTRHLQLALVPLFEDIDANIVFRWTSVSDDEKMFTTRPDASMNIARGASLGKRIGCGEVKPQYQALNHQAIAKDLIRVGHLLKDASDKNQDKMTFGFVVVGNHGTFYILSRAQEYLYLMCEIEHIQLPMVLAEIPLFLAQLDKAMNIVASFAQVARQEHHNYDRHPLTLTDHKLFAITDPKTSRKRKSITSHYTH